MNKQLKFKLQNKAKGLQSWPGVYQMLDEKGHVIYVGKSVDVKRRVMSYFTPSAKRSKKITRMIHHIKDFNIYYTDTELDALLLECKWIKNYKPFYNTALTRDHKYIYIDLYEEPYYRIEISKELETDAQMRIGPFTNHRLALQGVEYIKNNYAYLVCKYKDAGNMIGCYQYQLKRCPGVCNETQKKSGELLIEQILGKESNVLERMMQVIERLAENMEYERAALLVKQKNGMRYLQVMYQLLTDIAKHQAYIGVLPLPNQSLHKYYLIKNGQIVHSQTAYHSQEREIVKQYRKLAKKVISKSGCIKVNEIDEMLIIESFRRKKLRLIKV